MSGHGAERQTGCVCIMLVARFCRLRIRNGTFRRYLRRKSRNICKTQFCGELSFFVRLNISAGSACTVPVNVSSKTSDFSINLSQLARRYSTVCAGVEVSIGDPDMPGRTVWIHVVLHAQLYPWWAVGVQVAAETNFSLLTLTSRLTSPRQGRAEQYLGARFINILVYTESYSSGPRVKRARISRHLISVHHSLCIRLNGSNMPTVVIILRPCSAHVTLGFVGIQFTATATHTKRTKSRQYNNKPNRKATVVELVWLIVSVKSWSVSSICYVG